jgi:hypothetical protein
MIANGSGRAHHGLILRSRGVEPNELFSPRTTGEPRMPRDGTTDDENAEPRRKGAVAKPHFPSLTVGARMPSILRIKDHR